MDWSSRYLEISKKLHLDVNGDKKATEILDSLIDEPNLNVLEEGIKGKKVIIFGCGPSLEEDVKRVKELKLREYTIIAADGSVKALLNESIIPHVNVTDLDGDMTSILWSGRLGTLTVVHGHADNAKKLRRYVPRLRKVVGTTQTTPTKKIHNFGGFTDGDRAVSMAISFGANIIILAGMDFGRTIGRYSGFYNRKKKLAKLEIGKQIIESLAKERGIPILNLTSKGEDIEHVPRVSIRYLQALG